MRLAGLIMTAAALGMAPSAVSAQQTGSASAQIELRIVVPPACATPDRVGSPPACNFAAERRLPLTETRQERQTSGGAGSGANVTVITYTP